MEPYKITIYVEICIVMAIAFGLISYLQSHWHVSGIVVGAKGIEVNKIDIIPVLVGFAFSCVLQPDLSQCSTSTAYSASPLGCQIGIQMHSKPSYW